MDKLTMDKIVNVCKQYGFIYQGSEIYGGLANTWDYGPLGSRLKNNIKDAWRKRFIQENKNSYEIDADILMHPRVWEASGHVGGFSDPLIDCKECKSRHRADKLIEEFDHNVNGDALSEEEMIEIGQETNIQDQCVLHTDRGCPLKIGDRVTIGHGAIVHGCTIEDEVLIGMGAIVLNGACIGSHSIIGAGCVVPENMVIPQKSVVVGVPAKIIKKTSESQVSDILSNAQHYINLSKKLD